jgi:hypothetical protein
MKWSEIRNRMKEWASKRNRLENDMQGLKVSAIVPQQIANLMAHLMGPVNCCADKIGWHQPMIYVHDNKSYCEDCIKKVAEADASTDVPVELVEQAASSTQEPAAPQS